MKLRVYCDRGKDCATRSAFGCINIVDLKPTEGKALTWNCVGQQIIKENYYRPLDIREDLFSAIDMNRTSLLGCRMFFEKVG